MDRYATDAGFCYPRIEHIRVRAGSPAVLDGPPPGYGNPVGSGRR